MSKQHRNADKILAEKVIRALLLLEGLTKQKLPFVFKGGTALMLHFNSIKRLSIDIDIILPNEIKDLGKKWFAFSPMVASPTLLHRKLPRVGPVLPFRGVRGARAGTFR